jgi:uncharacterized membrane protein
MFREAYHPAMNGHHVMFAHFIGFLFFVFVCSLIFHAAIRYHRRKYGNHGFHQFHGHRCNSNHYPHHASQALELLNTRYVNGEITDEEYLKIKTNITQ